MLFSSLEFLYLFLPLTLFAYFALPYGAKNYVLLVASLLFYGVAQPRFLPLMLAVAIFDYFFGLFIFRATQKGSKRAADVLCGVAVVCNVAVLFVFKYLDAILVSFGA